MGLYTAVFSILFCKMIDMSIKEKYISDAIRFLFHKKTRSDFVPDSHRLSALKFETEEHDS